MLCPPMRRPPLVTRAPLQYGVPVFKYDRKGFKVRQRQLLLTQKAAYVVELAKIKQKIEYSALRGKKWAVLRPLLGLTQPAGHDSQEEIHKEKIRGHARHPQI